MPGNLPIQKVSFRGEADCFLTEGGGSKSLPQWVNEELIIENSTRVYGQLLEFTDLFDDDNRTLPLLTEVSLSDKATAKSYRSSIRQLFDIDNKRNTIGVKSVGKLIVKVDSKNDLSKIARRFNDYGIASKNKKLGMAAIQSIEKYQAVVEDGINNGDSLKIQLIDYQNSEYNDLSTIQLKTLCREFGLDVEELYYASNLRLFSIDDISLDALERIVSMDSVLSVKKMPTIEFEIAPEPENTNIGIMNPVDGEQYPIVGLLDSGVRDIYHLRPWINGEDNTADLLDEDISRSHGTAVAGVINYGDLLENQNMTGCGPCKIHSCIVNSNRISIKERQLIMFIQRAILAHPDIKIWNLSQGSNITIKDSQYSEFGMALDSLQSNNRILICKSAGNDSSCTPLRITEGADSLLSLVVGSVAHKKTTNLDAEVGERSPFSRIGPGVENIVKPDVVHYGGNRDTHLSLFSEWGRQYCLYSGTSFSTPRIASLAANLQQKIGGECNPLLIKALIVHYSNYPANISKSIEEIRKEMGFGLPCVINDMLSNDANECTLVFTHTLKKGRDIVSLDFPFPSSLVENGKYIGEVTVTMAVNPILNASQGNEYCQSQVDVLLQTYDHVEHVPLGWNTMIRNEYRTSADAINVLNANLYSKSAFQNTYANERMLIEHGDKYQPIKKYYVDLSKMTNSNKEKALTSNRKWALKLNGLYRDYAEQSLYMDGEVLSQEVVVVITIKDPLERGTAYSECLRLLEERGYAHNDINIHNNIEIDVR